MPEKAIISGLNSSMRSYRYRLSFVILVFSELGRYTDEYLEVDARHGTGQYGKVFFIEQVIDAAL